MAKKKLNLSSAEIISKKREELLILTAKTDCFKVKSLNLLKGAKCV